MFTIDYQPEDHSSLSSQYVQTRKFLWRNKSGTLGLPATGLHIPWTRLWPSFEDRKGRPRICYAPGRLWPVLGYPSTRVPNWAVLGRLENGSSDQ